MKSHLKEKRYAYYRLFIIALMFFSTGCTTEDYYKSPPKKEPAGAFVPEFYDDEPERPRGPMTISKPENREKKRIPGEGTWSYGGYFEFPQNGKKAKLKIYKPRYVPYD